MLTLIQQEVPFFGTKIISITQPLDVLILEHLPISLLHHVKYLIINWKDINCNWKDVALATFSLKSQPGFEKILPLGEN